MTDQFLIAVTPVHYEQLSISQWYKSISLNIQDMSISLRSLMEQKIKALVSVLIKTL